LAQVAKLARVLLQSLLDLIPGDAFAAEARRSQVRQELMRVQSNLEGYEYDLKVSKEALAQIEKRR
jgi:hypothetical protein